MWQSPHTVLPPITSSWEQDAPRQFFLIRPTRSIDSSEQQSKIRVATCTCNHRGQPVLRSRTGGYIAMVGPRCHYEWCPIPGYEMVAIM